MHILTFHLASPHIGEPFIPRAWSADWLVNSLSLALFSSLKLPDPSPNHMWTPSRAGGQALFFKEGRFQHCRPPWFLGERTCFYPSLILWPQKCHGCISTAVRWGFSLFAYHKFRFNWMSWVSVYCLPATLSLFLSFWVLKDLEIVQRNEKGLLYFPELIPH